MGEIKTGYGVFSNMSTEEFRKCLDDFGIEYWSLGEHISRIKILRDKSRCFANANSEHSAMYQNDVDTLDFVIQALENAVGVHLVNERCKFCYCDENFYPNDLPDIPDRSVNGKAVGERRNTHIAFNKEDNGWYIHMPMGADIPINYCPYCGKELPKIKI